MGTIRRSSFGEGSHLSHNRRPKIYRGSRKRLRRITWRDNPSPEFWFFVVAMLTMFLVGVPWLIYDPPQDRHPRSAPVGYPPP